MRDAALEVRALDLIDVIPHRQLGAEGHGEGDLAVDLDGVEVLGEACVVREDVAGRAEREVGLLIWIVELAPPVELRHIETRFSAGLTDVAGLIVLARLDVEPST